MLFCTRNTFQKKRALSYALVNIAELLPSPSKKWGLKEYALYSYLQKVFIF